MGQGHGFLKRFSFCLQWLPSILITLVLLGIGLSCHGLGDRGIIAGLAALAFSLAYVDTWFIKLGYICSGIWRTSAEPDEASTARIAQTLEQLRMPERWSHEGVDLKLFNPGAAPLFTGSTLFGRELWLSTYTLQNTRKEDFPWLTLVALGYLQGRPPLGCLRPMAIMWILFTVSLALWGWIVAANAIVVAITQMAALQQARGSYLRQIFDWVPEDERRAFVSALLRYAEQFERSQHHTQERMNTLRSMRFTKDEALSYLESSRTGAI